MFSKREQLKVVKVVLKSPALSVLAIALSVLLTEHSGYNFRATVQEKAAQASGLKYGYATIWSANGLVIKDRRKA